MLSVFGYDDAPHGHAEVVFDNVRVPAANLCSARDAASRSRKGGSARAHPPLHAHDRRRRARARADVQAREEPCRFGRTLAEMGVIKQWIAHSRMEIEQARLLTLKAAYMMDTAGNKAARSEIAQIKVIAPNMACAWSIARSRRTARAASARILPRRSVRGAAHVAARRWARRGTHGSGGRLELKKHA
jgi:acyl-CoA dehydrogenase